MIATTRSMSELKSPVEVRAEDCVADLPSPIVIAFVGWRRCPFVAALGLIFFPLM